MRSSLQAPVLVDLHTAAETEVPCTAAAAADTHLVQPALDTAAEVVHLMHTAVLADIVAAAAVAARSPTSQVSETFRARPVQLAIAK